jgi:hypothetical protein
MILLVLIGLNFTICAVLVRNGLKSIQVIVPSDPELDRYEGRVESRRPLPSFTMSVEDGATISVRSLSPSELG